MKQERKRYADAELSRWLSRCNPSAPVAPGSELHYNLDAPGKRLRGGYNLDRMVQPISLSGSSSCQLFTGFSGTGKSTELLQLKKDLEAQGFLVLLADAQEYLTLSRPLEIADLLVIIAGAFDDETEKVAPATNKVAKRYWDKLADLLKSEVELTEVGFDLKVADLKLNIKHGNRFWNDVRSRLADTPGRLEKHVHDHVRECTRRLLRRRPEPRGVVFILDSLEQLRGAIDQFQETMASAVRVFLDYSRELRLPDCHVIYTVPPYLPLLAPAISGLYDQISEILPAVKIETIAGKNPLKLKPFRDGIAALRELVGLRVPLEVFFGDELANLDDLIRCSGGHVRTLISMVRDLVYLVHEAGAPLDGKDVEEVARRYRERARLGIWEEDTLLLDRIRREASVEGIRKEDLATVADFMDRQLVLCYRNGEGWYEVHPLVRDYVEERARRLRPAEAENPAG